MQPLNIETRERSLYQDRNLQLIVAVSLMAVLGVASITPAFPRMVEALNIPADRIGWLVTFFTFPTVVLSPVLGVLTDRLGRKAVLVPSLLLFGLAGGACAFAQDFNTLLLLRGIQGIGATPLLSLSVTLLGDLYSGARLTSAIGLNSSISSIGTGIYPIVGGTLALWGWNYPFWLSILAIPIGLLALFGLQSPPCKPAQSLRVYLVRVGKSLQNRRLVGLFLSSTFSFILLYGVHITFLPLLLSNRFGSSSVEIGLILSTVPVAVTLTSAQLGPLSAKLPTRMLVRVSFMLYGSALVMIPFVSHPAVLLVPALLFGVGLGIGLPSIQALLAELAPKEYLGAIVSFNGTFLGLGQTLGPLLAGMVFALGGINSVFLTGTAFALFALLVFRQCTCL